MTHDELLAKIDPYGMDDYEDYKTQYGKALCSIIELHKPIEVKDILLCKCEPVVYPCPTIQAIVKELE